MALEPLDSQPLRCTADFIALHARERPRHVAVMSDDHETTYAALHAELTAMIGAMARLGLPRGGLVALAHPDIRPRLLVTLALERLGVTLVAFRADATSLDDPVLARADLVMSATGIDPGRCKRFLRMTDDWLADALSGDALSGDALSGDALSGDAGAVVLAKISPDDRLLMTRTSGSTGRPKAMVITRAVVAARVAQRIALFGYRPDDRFLAAMNFTVAAMYFASLAMLRIGATVASGHAVTLAEALSRYRPTKMNLLPYQLLALLRDSPDLPRLPDLVLLMTGANVTPTLRRQALARLCGRVIDAYASNEAGWIGCIDDDGHTRLNPWMDVDIVGADGASVPPETVGEIRVRGPSVITGYEGDPAATAAAARDGWWHTGDFGLLTSDGALRLLGRRDDVLNFGGIKRAAGDVEAEILALGISHDIAVLVGQSAAGDAIPVICVAAAGPDVAAIADRLRGGLIGVFAVYRVDEIPRTPDGKVRRRDLRREIAGRAPLQLPEAGPDPATAREAA